MAPRSGRSTRLGHAARSACAGRLGAYEVLDDDEVGPEAAAGADGEKDVAAGPYAELGGSRFGEFPRVRVGSVGAGPGALDLPLLLGGPGTQEVAQSYTMGRPVIAAPQGRPGPARAQRRHASARCGVLYVIERFTYPS